MTVGVVIQCKDGVVMASDSLTTFTRGVPVTRNTNKLHVIQHGDLLHPIALVGAGMSAFIDKFVDRVKREGIARAAEVLGRKLDIVDFVECVGESICSNLFKEYMIQRAEFFGGRFIEYSLSLIVAGATTNGEMRCYHVHSPGLAESIEGYGTVGSGAAYAELFLHGFLPEPDTVRIDEAVELACYTIKGAEIMDPNVGGDAKLCKLTMSGQQLIAEYVHQRSVPQSAKDKMEKVLKNIGDNMKKIIADEGELQVATDEPKN